MSRVANFQTLVWELILFVILQTFLLLFLYMLKTKTFLHILSQTTSKHPKIQKFWLYFAKDFCDSKQKREQRFHPAGSYCAWAGLRPVVTRTLSTSRSFQTFFKHNVGNPEDEHNDTTYRFYNTYVLFVLNSCKKNEKRTKVKWFY